jgi:hypothetical protein
MIELARYDLGLSSEALEMLLFARDLEVAAAQEIALYVFLADNFFDAVDRGNRGGIHLPRLFAPILSYQLIHSELEAGENHAAIARTGAPTNGFGFENSDARAFPGQFTRGRESREPSTNYRRIRLVRQAACPVGLRHVDRGKPVIPFLDGHPFVPIVMKKILTTQETKVHEGFILENGRFFDQAVFGKTLQAQ